MTPWPTLGQAFLLARAKLAFGEASPKAGRFGGAWQSKYLQPIYLIMSLFFNKSGL